MVSKRKSLDFEAMISKGELNGVDGFQAQTPNGTAQWRGTGWNDDPWAKWTRPQLEPDRTRPSGRSNRTGE